MFLVLGSADASAEPAWCKTEGAGKPTWISVEEALKQDDPLRALPALVGETCWPDNEAKLEDQGAGAGRRARVLVHQG